MLTDMARDFIHQLHKMRSDITQRTGMRNAILEIRVSGDYGLALGILPGTSAEIDGVIVHSDQHVVVCGEMMTARDLKRRAMTAYSESETFEDSETTDAPVR